MKKGILLSLGLLTAVAFGYENCGRVYFTPMLTTADVDNSGNTISGGPTDTGGGGGSVDATPTPTPTPAPSPTGGGGGNGGGGGGSGSGDTLCILLNAGNNGQDNKIAYDIAIAYLTDQHAIPGAVCMSANACLNLINNYLNLTGGSFTAKPAAQLPATLTQYTAQKFNGVCSGNPNVIHFTDDQITLELDKLKNRP